MVKIVGMIFQIDMVSSVVVAGIFIYLTHTTAKCIFRSEIV